MPRWAPFVGLTVFLLVSTLWLAHRSTSILRDGLDESASDERADSGRAVAPDPARSPLTPTVLLANLALTQGLLLGSLVGGMLVFEIPWEAAGLGPGTPDRDVVTVALGLGLGTAVWLASEAAGRVADAAGLGYAERLRERLAPETPLGWVALFVVVLPLIAAGEELLFRGALIGVTATGFGVSPWLLVVVSSVAFALGHGAQGRVGIAATGLFGAVIAIAFVLTADLVVVVVAHYVVNALEFGVHEFR